MNNDLNELPFEKGKLFIEENYLEAVGIMNALKSGVAPETVRRPLAYTNVKDYRKKQDMKDRAQQHDYLNNWTRVQSGSK